MLNSDASERSNLRSKDELKTEIRNSEINRRTPNVQQISQNENTKEAELTSRDNQIRDQH